MTKTEERFLRQLRDLLRFHNVKLAVELETGDPYEPNYETWFFRGPEIELEMETVAEELEQP